jgi:flagellar hook-length control protein FliK
MSEFLSVTLLSAEPVSVAKPQASQPAEAATEPDQSFAATLAAEVNGKAVDKSGKHSAKTRQNTASDQTHLKKDSAETQDSTTSDVKADKPQAGKDKTQALTDDPISEQVEPELTQLQNEKSEAEHSHWLNLLEKAKNLQERLGKAEESKTAGRPETEQKAESAKSDELAQLIATAKLKNDKTTETALADTAASAKAKLASQPDAAIALDEKQLGESSAEQLLTKEELAALKLVGQADKTATDKAITDKAAADKTLADKAAAVKHQAAEAGLKSTPAESAQTEQGLIESAEKQWVSPDLGVKKHTGPDPTKNQQVIEKPIKTLLESETAPQVESGTEIVITATTSSKNQISAEAAASSLKAMPSVATADESAVAEETPADSDSQLSLFTEPKVSVQAQSAAALVTAPAAQTKAATTEPKVTTEEALKQIQTAATAMQGEQGSSSSSGESPQQGSPEALLTGIEQQKSAVPLATETNSFSNQLKASLEKSASAITVSSRELVSEQSQKQVDQLGQKLNLIQPEASNQLKEKMLMMVKDKVHTAEIRLDPSELGSMQIKISLQQDQMSVQFMVQQGNAKDLMEQQMPKLKELLQQQGIELSQGSVQQQNQSSSGQEGGRRTAGGSGSGSSLDAAEEPIAPASLVTKNPDRVVDYYA